MPYQIRMERASGEVVTVNCGDREQIDAFMAGLNEAQGSPRDKRLTLEDTQGIERAFMAWNIASVSDISEM